MLLWFLLGLVEADEGGAEAAAQAFVTDATAGRFDQAMSRCEEPFRAREQMSCASLVRALSMGSLKAEVGDVARSGDVARVMLGVVADGLPFVLWLRAERREAGWRFTDGTDLDSGHGASLVPEVPLVEPSALLGSTFHRFSTAMQAGDDAALASLCARSFLRRRDGCRALGSAMRASGASLFPLTAQRAGERAVGLAWVMAQGQPVDIAFVYLQGEGDAERVVGLDDDEEHVVAFLAQGASGGSRSARGRRERPQE